MTTRATGAGGMPCLYRGASDLLQRATALRGLLNDEAEPSEASGKLTDRVVGALHEGGFFGVWVPQVLNGSELAPCASLELIAELSYADASTGWVVMIVGLETGTSAAYLGDDAVKEMFGKARFPVIAGQGTRPGVAVREKGGYRVSGSWSFGSGMRHAEYTHSLALVDGGPEARLCKTPIDQVTLLDNWDVMGLRATGSIDYKLSSVFVPEAYTHLANTKARLRGGALYRLGVIDFACLGHSGWALGVGRRLLDEMATYARSKIGQPGQVAGSEAFHAGYAKAEAKFRAARSLVFETWADIEETLDADEPLSVRQETLLRLALSHATWTVEEVSAFVYAACGTTALRSGTIQRFYRDVHAGTQHITSGPAPLQACGRELAGLAKGQDWLFLGLVEPKASCAK